MTAQNDGDHLKDLGKKDRDLYFLLSSFSFSSLFISLFLCLSVSFPPTLPLIDLSSQVTLGEYEGGGTHSLLSSSSDAPVCSTELYEYVCRYAELRMIRVIEEPLQVLLKEERERERLLFHFSFLIDFVMYMYSY